jgi:hypothetical protein
MIIAATLAPSNKIFQLDGFSNFVSTTRHFRQGRKHDTTVNATSGIKPSCHPCLSHGTHAAHGNEAPAPHRGAVESRDSRAHALQSATHAASGARATSTRLQQRPAHVVLSYA